MPAYSHFARCYDQLTRNIDYRSRAEYFDTIIRRYRPDAKLLLDLACGTGSLSLELDRLGYEVIGVDLSEEMLSQAAQKRAESGQNILFLCQDMAKLDLYGTVDATVCALDSVNHVTNPETLLKAFRRVSLFTNPGGVFVFDCNTPYKHRHILGNHIFLYDYDDLYCVWKNRYVEKDDVVKMELDLFEKQGENYRRCREAFSERAYPHKFWLSLLQQTGFELLGYFADKSFDPPKQDTQRIVYAARKKKVAAQTVGLR